MPSGEGWNTEREYVANAMKGDLILSAGCGDIGTLLRAVTPRQVYSHEGFMTLNQTEVRHGTAITSRLEDEKFWEKEVLGLFPKRWRGDIFTYGFQGTTTQSISNAYNNEVYQDPEGGPRNYNGFYGGLRRCDGDEAVAFPLVVKPQPRLEQADPTIRQRLRGAAEESRKVHGHYRFFAYTDAAVGHDARFDYDPTRYNGASSWAKDTHAIVSSQFIWLALNRAGVHLEGSQTESSDCTLLGVAGAVCNGELAQVSQAGIPNRATATQSQVDGVYLYTEPERRAGATTLYDNVFNKVAKSLEAKDARILASSTDSPDNLANQTVNCFRDDTCAGDDATEGDSWREDTGTGRAVSPDNFLLWDGPETGGVYGYSERLIRASRRHTRKFIWAPAEGTATVAGTVTLNGKAVPFATVVIGGRSVVADATGFYKAEALAVSPFGYEVSSAIALNSKNEPCALPPGQLYDAGALDSCMLYSNVIDTTTNAKRLVLVDGKEAVVRYDIALLPPPDLFRQVLITFYVERIKNSNAIGKDIFLDGYSSEPLEVAISLLEEKDAEGRVVKGFTYKSPCVGEEVWMTAHGRVTLNADLSVSVDYNVQLYETYDNCQGIGCLPGEQEGDGRICDCEMDLVGSACLGGTTVLPANILVSPGGSANTGAVELNNFSSDASGQDTGKMELRIENRRAPSVLCPSAGPVFCPPPKDQN